MRELKLNLLEDDIISFNKSWKKLHKKIMNGIEVSDGLLLHQIIQQKINQYESEIKDKKVTEDKNCQIYNKIRGRQN